MAPSFEKCGNCGAPLEGAADGRSVQCVYCGAGEARVVDASRLAASLRAESQSSDQLFDGLARRLAEQFPDLVRVETSGGLFSSKRVDAFELTLEGAVYRMARARRGVVAERVEVVRGIAVKTETLPADAWIQSLCEDLSALAGTSARTFEALRRLAPES